MTTSQQLRLEMAINTANHWSKWLKTEKDKVDKKIFEENDYTTKVAIQAGSKTALTDAGIEAIDDILKLLKKIQNEQIN